MVIRRRRQAFIARDKKCPFCLKKQDPDYKQAEQLKTYLTQRGKIISGRRTGVCAKHQRRLARANKQARHLALLSFTTKI